MPDSVESKDFWGIIEIIAKAESAVLIPIVVVLSGFAFNSTANRRATAAQIMEISLGILRVSVSFFGLVLGGFAKLSLTRAASIFLGHVQRLVAGDSLNFCISTFGFRQFNGCAV